MHNLLIFHSLQTSETLSTDNTLKQEQSDYLPDLFKVKNLI